MSNPTPHRLLNKLARFLPVSIMEDILSSGLATTTQLDKEACTCLLPQPNITEPCGTIYLNLSNDFLICSCVNALAPPNFFSILANSFARRSCISSGDFSNSSPLLSLSAYLVINTFAANSSPSKYSSTVLLSTVVPPEFFIFLLQLFLLLC